MIGYEEIHSAIYRSSCIEAHDNFKAVMQELNIQPKIIVELGTFKGLATALLASISDKVYTFDIKKQAIAEPLWELLKVRDKIAYTIVNSTVDIGHYLKKHKIYPDFVFADGPHRHYSDVMKIFNMFKNLGAKRILFDDANSQWPGTLQVAEEIEAKIYDNRFAYWEAK